MEEQLITMTEAELSDGILLTVKIMFIIGVLAIMLVNGYSPFRNTLDNPNTHLSVKILVWIPRAIFYFFAFISGMMVVNIFVAIIIDIIKFLWIF